MGSQYVLLLLSAPLSHYMAVFRSEKLAVSQENNTKICDKENFDFENISLFILPVQ